MKNIMKNLNINKAFLILCLMLGTLTGCKDSTSPQPEIIKEEESLNINLQEDVYIDSKEIAETYKDIYLKATEEKKLGNLTVTRKIVANFGDEGFSAVDADNQIDMVNPEQVENFCKQVNAKNDEKVTLLSVLNNGDFIRYDLSTSQGAVTVDRSVINWKNGIPEVSFSENYSADHFIYTDSGYLFFAKYYPEGFDGMAEYVGLRVQGLSEDCRTMNRRYLLPIGYNLNNMFIIDWDEENFVNLCFYDLYETLYQMKYEKKIELGVAGVEETFDIAEREFEEVIMTYFKIDSNTLQQLTDYDEQIKSYRYKTRGSDDFAPTPYIPYPEVVDYEELEDGSIKLIVNAVWPKENTDKAFTHEVIIRNITENNFEYVSNHVIHSGENYEPSWYVNRGGHE